MNLYATTTSERASKGQGGNEYLNIDICIGGKTPTHTLKIRPCKTGGVKLLGTYHLALKEIADDSYLYAGYAKGGDICKECSYPKDEVILKCGEHYQRAQKGKR
jgi:hypothetical protein